MILYFVTLNSQSDNESNITILIRLFSLYEIIIAFPMRSRFRVPVIYTDHVGKPVYSFEKEYGIVSRHICISLSPIYGLMASSNQSI